MLTAKWEEHLGSVAIGKVLPRELSYSYSYDGVCVGTLRFKEVTEATGITGLAFRPLQSTLFAVRPVAVVRFDAIRRKTQFERLCGVCGQHEVVVGATPLFLLPGAMVPENGFARTDLEFGSRDAKTPVIVSGHEVIHIVQRARLRGLVFKEAVTVCLG